jgi:hypothetical protein
MAMDVWVQAEIRKPLAIFCGLSLEPGESAALLFRFYDSESLPVHVEKIVSLSETWLHRKFADGDATPRIQVHVFA